MNSIPAIQRFQDARSIRPASQLQAFAVVLLVMAVGIGNGEDQPLVIHSGPPFVTHSEPLASSQPGPPPARIPGTVNVTVRARGVDSSIPFGSFCWITPFPHSQPQRYVPHPADWPTNRPTVVGSNGDWVVYNITPFASGAWAIQIDCSNYLFTPEFNIQSVDPTNNRDVSLAFTLRLGATVMGRVLDAETGKPIVGATVVGGGYNQDQNATGADGRFTLRHLATNEGLSVAAPNTDYVWQSVSPAGLAEGVAATLPDVALRHGGWISGRMTLPADAPSGAPTVLYDPTIGGNSLPTDYPKSVAPNGVFRVGPLPVGSVGLSAVSFLFKSGNPWRAEGSVTNIHVEAGQETSNVLIELKTTRPSNGR